MSTEQETAIVRDTTPLTLIETAITQGIEPEKLGRLLDLQERWEANKAKQAYFEAMTECQAALPKVIRDKENMHTKAWYATLETVNISVMPVFTAHGFSISFNEIDCPVPESIKLLATVRHRDGHSEEFTAIIPLDSAGAKGGINKTATQAKGSTIAYGRRYLMLMIGNITVCDEDKDGNGEEPLLTEEQVIMLETKILDCANAGCPITESRFIGWLSEQQRSPATTLAELQQKVFLRAVAELDKRLRTKMRETAQ
jgi:hypothetical protein